MKNLIKIIVVLSSIVSGSVSITRKHKFLLLDSLRCMSRYVPASQFKSVYIYNDNLGLLSYCNGNNNIDCQWKWNSIHATEFIYDPVRTALKLSDNNNKWLTTTDGMNFYINETFTPVIKIDSRVFIQIWIDKTQFTYKMFNMANSAAGKIC